MLEWIAKFLNIRIWKIKHNIKKLNVILNKYSSGKKNCNKK